jgi:acetyl-CoA carboxylase carboxyltransferase component
MLNTLVPSDSTKAYDIKDVITKVYYLSFLLIFIDVHSLS